MGTVSDSLSSYLENLPCNYRVIKVSFMVCAKGGQNGNMYFGNGGGRGGGGIAFSKRRARVTLMELEKGGECSP